MRAERKFAEMSDSDDEMKLDQSGRAKWIWRIVEKLGEANMAEDSCIYKVPSKLRYVKQDQDAYNPRVVSIGPLHRKDPDLVAGMRKHKWRYMLRFLKQTDDPAESRKCLNNCTKAIYDLDKEVRQCYAGSVEYDKDELAQIMLLDGCFILELFLRCYAKSVGKRGEPDPVFESYWMMTPLQHDLALLENQIPFFVLERLYDVVKPFVEVNGCGLPYSVAGLALMFFQRFSLKSIPKEQDEPGTDFKHLLDLLHKFYFLLVAAKVPHDHEVSVEFNFNMELSSSIKEQPLSLCNLFFRKMRRKMQTFLFLPEPDDLDKLGFNCSTSEILESGIQFQTGSSQDQLLNITFGNGVITIPQLLIDVSVSSVLKNLIAFEQCSLSNTHGVTSYAFLIKSLIRSLADSKLLEQNGIIKHKFGDQERSSQFEGIVDGVVMKDFYFGRLCDQVNDYTRRYWFRRYMKYLYRTYFSTAWSMIAFIAGICVFVLTFLQTYFTINPR